MSKERLEEIRGRVVLDKVYYKNLAGTKGYWGKSYTLNEDDYNYLIEQAERVQELEEEDERLRALDIATTHELNHVDKINKRYREALEFYANKINYLTFIENGKSNIEHDQGEKARKALEGDLE